MALKFKQEENENDNIKEAFWTPSEKKEEKRKRANQDKNKGDWRF